MKQTMTCKSASKLHTVAATAALLLIAATGCDAQTELSKARSSAEEVIDRAGASSAQTEQVRVEEVTDGDTIEISRPISGRTKVRLIGIDTPEVYNGQQPLGPQASSFAKQRLQGQTVRLELGREKVDPYDRLLAYATVSGQNATYNEQVLRAGLAQTAWFPPNTAHKAQFERAQSQAREHNRGIWGVPAAQQCALSNRDNRIGEGSPGC